MSRAYRIRVSESVQRVLRAGDRVSTQLEILEVLPPEQMAALEKARGAQFDHLFLTGMIQHHGGALTMVDELFDTPAAGQDGQLYDFATDVDNTQSAEIKIMQSMLKEKP